jgi:hypothetical protein
MGGTELIHAAAVGDIDDLHNGLRSNDPDADIRI